MKQLSGLDASFLYLETGRQFGHVSGLAVFRRPDGHARFDAYEAVKAKIQSCLPDLEPLRRRLVEVPLRLDHPYWIDDPDFDIEFHVRETAVPPPGTRDQLSQLVARLIARPLDRSHPLWECYVIDGLEGDCFAVLTKLHHATIDGAAGAELMTVVYDYEPGPVPPPAEIPPPPGEEVPSPAQMVARAVTGSLAKPGKFVTLQVRTMRALGDC